MAQSLYQRYRPQQFSEMIGQEHVRSTLMSEVLHHDTAHAYLLSGPRGVGKTTTARLIARAVNCTQPAASGEPCGTCAECVMIFEQRALDVMEIDAASHTGVDHVREQIIEHARTSPSRLKMKVFIIDEVHMLSTSAFNALLKTLEEPPQHALFILATTELHKVPATIISRCEHFRFVRLTPEQIADRLKGMCTKEGRLVDDAVLRHIARRADGAMRDAESILGQVLAIQAETITLEHVAEMLNVGELQRAVTIVQCIAQQDVVGALAEIRQGVASGAQPLQVIIGVIGVLRAAVLSRACSTESYLISEVGDVDTARALYQSFSTFSPERLARCIEHCMRAQEQQKTSTLPELPLELAVIHCIQGDQPVVREQPTQKTSQKTSQQVSVAAPSKAMPVQPQQPAQQVVDTPSPMEAGVVVEPVQVPKKIESETTPAQTQPVVEVPVQYTREQVEQLWPKVLESMKKRNQGLHVTLQVGKLVDIKGKIIHLGFQYQFYQDRILEGRNRKMIDEALLEALGKEMHIEPIIGDQFEMKETMDAAGNVEVVAAKELENVWDLAVHAFQPKHIEDIS